MVGKVFLVGAGPGDPGLITLRGMQVLAGADAILYDGLINPEILTLAPSSCIQHCVGKRGHGGLWQQSQINDMLVELAGRFPRVVRLKGGDTSIFARTSEEIDRLQAEGIPYEVVPGITAAQAASAYAGIPITHRDWSSSVAFVAAQSQVSDVCTDSEESIDWDALARFPGTLVFYMGVSTAHAWSQRLIAAGKSATTPVAMIRRCSWPDQQVLSCELAQVAEVLARHRDFQPPVITIVGEVIRASTKQTWFTAQPLFGQRFAITGPEQSGSLLKGLLREQGAQCILAPGIVIEPPSDWSSLDHALAMLHETDWIVFSSMHGVQYFFERLHERGEDARALARVRVAAVGKSTAGRMLDYGIRCDLVPENDSGAEALLHELEPLAVGSAITLVRAPEGNLRLHQRLTEIGARIRSADAYQQRIVSEWPSEWRESILADPPCWIVATSSNGARGALQCLGDQARQLRWLSISPAVTEVLQSSGCSHVATSDRADHVSLVRKAVEANRKHAI